MKTVININGLDVDSRFASKFKQSELGCWEWTACKLPSGYGKYWDGNKLVRAHRHSYTVFVGEIGDGNVVCHKCDNPSCVRPDHLFSGTLRDNAADCTEKGRNPTSFKLKPSCHRGHSLSSDAVYSRIDKRCNLQRTCLICKAEYKRKWRANRARKVVEGVR